MTVVINLSYVPDAVLANQVRTGQIPERQVHWADERQWCRYALDNDAAGASTCPQLCSRRGQRPYCALNGAERRSPCAFDEPDDAPVWQRIRRYLASLAEMDARR